MGRFFQSFSLQVRKFFRSFSLFELILLAFLAACGVAAKPLITALTHIVSGPLFIPGGALSGGLYMLFVILGGALVEKRGAATLVCVIQCIMVMVTGIVGTHGAASLLTYIAPGLMVDLFLALRKTTAFDSLSCFFGCIIANVTGVYLTILVFFKLPLILLPFPIMLAVFSGGIGGIVAWNIAKTIKKEKVMD